MRKNSRPLSVIERELFAQFFTAETLLAAKIIDGHVPFWLHNNMCAVVIGCRIYFRAGVYQANTRRGITLLAHELTHVEQFLSGMTLLKYLWASRKGYQKNPYEIEAYAKGDYVCQQLVENKQITVF